MVKSKKTFVVSKRTFLLGLASVSVFSCATVPVGPDDSRYFEVYQDAKREWRWRFQGGNGQTIATSHEGYDSKRACLDAIEKVKRSSDARIIEVEE